MDSLTDEPLFVHWPYEHVKCTYHPIKGYTVHHSVESVLVLNVHDTFVVVSEVLTILINSSDDDE